MSKNLFQVMRERELATENFLPTKKELISNSRSFAKELMDSGDYDPRELFTEALRLKEAFVEIEKTLKTLMPQEDFEAFGVKGQYRAGGNTLNYKEHEVYNVLKADLDARVELLKLAQKQEVLDTSGNEVPKVSTTPRKSGLTITY